MSREAQLEEALRQVHADAVAMAELITRLSSGTVLDDDSVRRFLKG